MIKTTVKIDGMMCGMCESHICDVLRNKLGLKKVSASHKSGKAEIITDSPVDDDAVRSAIEETGYKVMSIDSEEYVKKGFFRK